MPDMKQQLLPTTYGFELVKSFAPSAACSPQINEPSTFSNFLAMSQVSRGQYIRCAFLRGLGRAVLRHLDDLVTSGVKYGRVGLLCTSDRYVLSESPRMITSRVQSPSKFKLHNISYPNHVDIPHQVR
ncbi:hypothetical protein M404DRAFT_996672 [Pisolithus tinctorius Marx 270]|uniref:Uncharacterized protein n=1 Tax=Pisolithus tinctorius Marx 270 TaxID=870435 RepID=A0A0C3JKY9_PISTI|nr:hypothetical protein M404DRAFT_996672 [Pisolithus tinctorius Marx 270]